jgi:hypothetical protein
MHPSLAPAERQLKSLLRAFEDLTAIETEVVAELSGSENKIKAQSILRAAQVEAIYTGIEKTLSEILKKADGSVYASGADWHVQLLAQAAGQNDINGRPPVISEAVYNNLTVLLAFRHAVRINYGFDLRKHDVEENLGRLNRIFLLS